MHCVRCKNAVSKNMLEIKQTVANHYGITVAELEGKSRELEIVIPRHIAIYLCRQCDFKLEEIAKKFNRVHSQIIYSCKCIQNYIDTNATFSGHHIKQDIEVLQKTIKNNRKMKLETIYIDIKHLLPLPNNAKIHTAEQIENIKNSIKEFGFNDPLGVWQDNRMADNYYVVTGNGTLEALKQLNYKTVPCNDLSNLDEDGMRAYAIAHNSTTLKTGFDLDILKTITTELDFNFN